MTHMPLGRNWQPGPSNLPSVSVDPVAAVSSAMLERWNKEGADLFIYVATQVFGVDNTKGPWGEATNLNRLRKNHPESAHISLF
jgi:hypothetical protein